MARILPVTAVVAATLLLLLLAVEPTQSAGSGGGRLTLRRGGISQIGRAKQVPPPPPPRKQAAVTVDEEHHVVEAMTSSTAVANVLADLCPHGMLPIGTSQLKHYSLATWSAAAATLVCVSVPTESIESIEIGPTVPRIGEPNARDKNSKLCDALNSVLWFTCDSCSHVYLCSRLLAPCVGAQLSIVLFPHSHNQPTAWPLRVGRDPFWPPSFCSCLGRSVGIPWFRSLEPPKW
jgi:hypothetical protein